LCGRFNEHNEVGELLLLSKLDNHEDTDFHAEIIFMLGRLNGKHRDKTLHHARLLANSDDDYTRDRAIIVLGWLGKMQDTKVFEQHLLTDNNINCRAWSASAFMQMWMRRQSEGLKKCAFECFKKALKTEKEMLVLTTIISAMQEITRKKFNISQKLLDDGDAEAITAAADKVTKYLDKICITSTPN
jgi:HEAT repeats